MKINTARNSNSLTIVIPTRERSDTLLYAIRTCVEQNYDNLRILIADNFSKDNTAAVVSSFMDKRVSYVNSGRRLSMSGNWEFALSHVDSDYVMFLGDDDGVLPGAVANLMNYAAENETIDAFTWPSVDYGWPSCPNSALRNTIVIPFTEGIDVRYTDEILSEVIRFKRPYSELPFIYKGLVKTSAVRKLRDASGGTVFHSMIPDVYFGIASCAVIEQYIYFSRPYTLNGASGHSNGTSSFSKKEGSNAEQLFLAEENLPFHPALTYCPSIPILITESLLQAHTKLPILRKHPVDFDATIRAAVLQLKRAEDNVFNDVINALQKMSSSISIKADTKLALASATHNPFSSASRVYGMDIFNKRFLIDCTEFDVNDCFSASILANSVLGLQKNKELSNLAAVMNAVRLLAREMKKRSR